MIKIICFLSFCLLFSLTLLVSCSSSQVKEINASMDREFTLKVGQVAVFTNENLKIQFESVLGDSRCPKGVTCIWAGEAKCQISIDDKGSSDNFVLTDIGGTDGYSTNYFKNLNLTFKLEPYPEQGKQIGINDYELILTVSKSG
jgi:hypothetical protein